MQVELTADGRTAAGGTTIITHNERLADPLDSMTQALAEMTSQRKKPTETHREIAYREFLGGLYTEPRLEWPLPKDTSGFVPGIPAWNVFRCLQEGAKRYKRGQDVLRGVSPIDEFCPLIYDGPTDPLDLYANPAFSIRKGVGVQRNRTMRTRPQFANWQLKLLVEVDPDIYNIADLELHWAAAGLYAGLCEMRPIWGRFKGTLEVVGESVTDTLKAA